MFGNQDGKPADVIVIESCKIDGEHVERGTVIKDMSVELAMELAGAGKVRAATPEAVKEIRAAVKAQAQAAAPAPTPVDAGQPAA